MLSYAAIVPNSPFFISEMGQENFENCKKTRSSFEVIRKKLEQLNIDTVLLIGQPANIIPGALNINLSSKYHSNFKRFGDFSIKKEFYPNHQLANELKFLKTENISTMLSTNTELDYTLSVPLIKVLENLKETTILPMGYSNNTGEQHFEIGQQIGSLIQKSTQKIAVLVSTNLTLFDETTAEEAKKQDEKIIQSLRRHSYRKLFKLEEEQFAPVTALKRLSLMQGVFMGTGLKQSFKLLSYESPFNIGFLASEYQFKTQKDS